MATYFAYLLAGITIPVLSTFFFKKLKQREGQKLSAQILEYYRKDFQLLTQKRFVEQEMNEQEYLDQLNQIRVNAFQYLSQVLPNSQAYQKLNREEQICRMKAGRNIKKRLIPTPQPLVSLTQS